MHAPGVFDAKRTIERRLRLRIGVSRYKYLAQLKEAPEIVNCYQLMRWAEASMGINLPEQLLQAGDLIEIDFAELQFGDMIFVERANHPNDDWGHVGFLTENGNVIDASSEAGTVIEESLEAFLSRTPYIGARRVPENLYCRSS